MNKPTITPKTAMPTPKAKPTAANRGANLLKTTLVIGSIVATLMGANLAAQTDQTATVLASTVTAEASNAVVSPAQQLAAVPNLATTDTTLDDLLGTQLAPIPNITIPTVVTSSRSSQ